MRPIPLTNLVILVLLVSGPCLHADGRLFKKMVRPVVSPVAPAQRARSQPKEAEANPSWTVDGWGETRADADQIALENARRSVLEFFALRNHRLEWQPNLSYVNKNLIKERQNLPEDPEEPLRHWQGVRLWIEIAPDKWEGILHEDRQVRAESRMLLLGKVLAGVVAFLGAIAGYLRLEEMTKGYYTAWLRLAAVGFVSAVGAGIWWIS